MCALCVRLRVQTSKERHLFVVVIVTNLKGLSFSFVETTSVTVICTEQNISLVLVNHLVQEGCHLEELLGKELWIHIPVTIEMVMLLNPFPTDLVTEHSTDLKVSVGHVCIEFLICWKASFVAHSGPTLTHILGRASSMTCI